MTKAIQQSVEFKASPQALFELYLDSVKHSKATGQPAKLGRKPGDRFTAFGGALQGKNLVIVPNKMIVQLWRSTSFKKADPDSILVLTFERSAKGGRVGLAHVNVPQHDHNGVSKGWNKYYWRPWRAYLAKNR